jgi:hypothetical protein
MSFKKTFSFQKRTKREEVNIIIGKERNCFFLFFSQSDDGHDDDDGGRHCHTCCTKSERERER